MSTERLSTGDTSTSPEPRTTTSTACARRSAPWTLPLPAMSIPSSCAVPESVTSPEPATESSILRAAKPVHSTSPDPSTSTRRSPSAETVATTSPEPSIVIASRSGTVSSYRTVPRLSMIPVVTPSASTSPWTSDVRCSSASLAAATMSRGSPSEIERSPEVCSTTVVIAGMSRSSDVTGPLATVGAHPARATTAAAAITPRGRASGVLMSSIQPDRAAERRDLGPVRTGHLDADVSLTIGTGSEGWIALVGGPEHRHPALRLHDIAPPCRRDPLDRASAAGDLAHRPPAVVLYRMVPLAERTLVPQRRVAAVLPGAVVVDLAAGCRNAASRRHAPFGTPLDELSQCGRGVVPVPADREHHPRLGVGEHPHPAPVAPAQLARPLDRDRSDSFHRGRLTSRVLVVEERQRGHRDHNAGPDAARLRRVRGRVALDEQIAHHIGAQLVERAGLAVHLPELLRDRGGTGEDRVRLDGRDMQQQLCHPVDAGLHRRVP